MALVEKLTSSPEQRAEIFGPVKDRLSQYLNAAVLAGTAVFKEGDVIVAPRTEAGLSVTQTLSKGLHASKYVAVSTGIFDETGRKTGSDVTYQQALDLMIQANGTIEGQYYEQGKGKTESLSAAILEDCQPLAEKIAALLPPLEAK